MLNMKKGLAIVLAAATALTFAPVSTLGLTGVVEAQAAEVTGVTSFNAVADQQIYGTSSKTITVTENVTGVKNDTDTLTVASSNTSAVQFLQQVPQQQLVLTERQLPQISLLLE